MVNIKKSSTETINNIAKEFFVTTDIQLFSKQNLQNMFNYFLYNKHDYNLFDVISENNIITSAGYANFLTQRNLSYLTNLEILSKPFNDVDLLSKKYPFYRDEFEIFEATAVNTDDSIFQNITLPQFKLYYPEPYIATPSFVHQDL